MEDYCQECSCFYIRHRRVKLQAKGPMSATRAWECLFNVTEGVTFKYRIADVESHESLDWERVRDNKRVGDRDTMTFLDRIFAQGGRTRCALFRERRRMPTPRPSSAQRKTREI